MTTWQLAAHSRQARPVEGMEDADIVKYAEFLAAACAEAAILLNNGKQPLAELRVSVTISPTCEFSSPPDEDAE
jgi:hypothetical protein